MAEGWRSGGGVDGSSASGSNGWWIGSDGVDMVEEGPNEKRVSKWEGDVYV